MGYYTASRSGESEREVTESGLRYANFFFPSSTPKAVRGLAFAHLLGSGGFTYPTAHEDPMKFGDIKQKELTERLSKYIYDGELDFIELYNYLIQGLNENVEKEREKEKRKHNRFD